MEEGIGYAPKSAVDRQISNGSAYDKYFPKPKDKVILLKKNGSTQDTVKFMIRMVRDYAYQTKDIAKVLSVYNADNTLNIYKTVKNVYNFVCKYIKYNVENGEQLQQPAHTWYQAQILARKHPSNKTYSADCDCMAIFCACIFDNLRIPNVSFKIAGYNIIGGYQHVYVIVDTDQGQIICDPVYWQFDAEKEPIKHKEFSMSTLAGTDIYMLAGTDNTLPIGNQYVEKPDGSLGLLGKSKSKKEKKAKKKAAKKDKKAAKKEIKSARKEVKKAKKSGDSAALATAKEKLQTAKEKKQTAKETIDANRTGIAKAVSKAGKFVKNTTLLAARAPFLLLMRLNFRGMAKKMSDNQNAYRKFSLVWKKLGGKVAKLDKAIEKGKGKKALFGSKKTKSLSGQLGEIGEVMYEYGMLTAQGIQGLGFSGLGDPMTAAAAAIAAATPIIKKVMSVLKEVGDALPESGEEEVETESDSSAQSEQTETESDYATSTNQVVQTADSEVDDGYSDSYSEEYYEDSSDDSYSDDYSDNYIDSYEDSSDSEEDYSEDEEYDDDMEGFGYFFVGDTIEEDGTLGKGFFKAIWKKGKAKVKKLLKPTMGSLGKKDKTKKTKSEKKTNKANKQAAKKQNKANKQATKSQNKASKQAAKSQKQSSKTTDKSSTLKSKANNVASKLKNLGTKLKSKTTDVANKVKNSKVVQNAKSLVTSTSNSAANNTIKTTTMDNSKTTDNKTIQSDDSNTNWFKEHPVLTALFGTVVVGGIGFAIYKGVTSSKVSGCGYIEPMQLS